MSQFPQQPQYPQQPQQPYPGQVPPGQYPPGQYPPGYGGPMQAKQSNGMAIASLICGIIGCVPLLQIVAIILGFLGLSKAKDPRVGGKGMAITGIVLGFLWILGYIGFWGAIAAFVSGTAGQRQFVKDFTTTVASGDVNKAMDSTIPGVDKQDVVELSDHMKTLGALKDTTVIGINATPGETTVTCIAEFDKGNVKIDTLVVKQGELYKIKKLLWQKQ